MKRVIFASKTTSGRQPGRRYPKLATVNWGASKSTLIEKLQSAVLMPNHDKLVEDIKHMTREDISQIDNLIDKLSSLRTILESYSKIHSPSVADTQHYLDNLTQFKW